MRPAVGMSARASIRRSALAEWTTEVIDEITARTVESARGWTSVGSAARKWIRTSAGWHEADADSHSDRHEKEVCFGTHRGLLVTLVLFSWRMTSVCVYLYSSKAYFSSFTQTQNVCHRRNIHNLPFLSLCLSLTFVDIACHRRTLPVLVVQPEGIFPLCV